ncbi:hypothetical protein [Longimicrobium sp.]|uniref:hypothetical protein n=1 Tax=Longimicrobium sp. TaxID=2029185 RepID=UPI002BF92F28|nr:hypothetical protein [Longimicrobium sp.]HSU16859.1 hypothetical protein [Longimicrobium sp.]
MYVLVQHYISDPATFWSDVRDAVGALPPGLVLHHVFPTADGTHAVCLWEAAAVRDVKAFIETYVGHVSRNLYFQVENRDSVAMPGNVLLPEPARRATAA